MISSGSSGAASLTTVGAMIFAAGFSLGAITLGATTFGASLGGLRRSIKSMLPVISWCLIDMPAKTAARQMRRRMMKYVPSMPELFVVVDELLKGGRAAPPGYGVFVSVGFCVAVARLGFFCSGVVFSSAIGVGSAGASPISETGSGVEIVAEANSKGTVFLVFSTGGCSVSSWRKRRISSSVKSVFNVEAPRVIVQSLYKGVHSTLFSLSKIPAVDWQSTMQNPPVMRRISAWNEETDGSLI